MWVKIEDYKKEGFHVRTVICGRGNNLIKAIHTDNGWLTYAFFNDCSCRTCSPNWVWDSEEDITIDYFKTEK